MTQICFWQWINKDNGHLSFWTKSSLASCSNQYCITTFKDQKIRLTKFCIFMHWQIDKIIHYNHYNGIFLACFKFSIYMMTAVVRSQLILKSYSPGSGSCCSNTTVQFLQSLHQWMQPNSEWDISAEEDQQRFQRNKHKINKSHRDKTDTFIL